jgi:hypothetical protein
MNDVRDALHALTEHEPPPDLVGRVVTGANRRRRHNLMLTAASLAAVLAVALPVVALDHRAGPAGSTAHPTYPDPGTSVPPPINTAPTPTGSARPPRPGGGPEVLDAFVILAADPADQTSMLLNRTTGEYVELPFASITLSPDGNTLAVESRGTRSDAHRQVGVVSRADALSSGAARVRWLTEGSRPVWSPDGTKLLVETTRYPTAFPSPDPGHDERRLAVFDAGDWQRSDFGLALDLRSPYVTFGWSADSNHLVVPLRAPHDSDANPRGGDLQYVNLNGTLGQRVSVAGDMIAGPDAYSPARQRVIIGGIAGNRVVDATDWHTIYTDKDGVLAGWYDEGHVIRIRWAEPDSGGTPYLEVVDLAGHVTRQLPMPGNTTLGVQFRSSAGLTGDATKLGF